MVSALIKGLFGVYDSGIRPEHVDDVRHCALMVLHVRSESGVVAEEDGWLCGGQFLVVRSLACLSLCRSLDSSNVLAPRVADTTREATLLCAGDDHITTRTVAS